MSHRWTKYSQGTPPIFQIVFNSSSLAGFVCVDSLDFPVKYSVIYTCWIGNHVKPLCSSLECKGDGFQCCVMLSQIEYCSLASKQHTSSTLSWLTCRETPGNSHQPRGLIHVHFRTNHLAPDHPKKTSWQRLPSSVWYVLIIAFIITVGCNHTCLAFYEYGGEFSPLTKDGLMSDDIEICVLSGVAKPFKNNSSIASIPCTLS